MPYKAIEQLYNDCFMQLYILFLIGEKCYK